MDHTDRSTAECLACGLYDYRTAFYQAKPDQVPGFDDVCPVCGSTDVNVYAAGQQPMEDE